MRTPRFASLWEGFWPRFATVLVVIACCAAAVWTFRAPLLRSVSALLVREDPLARVDALYVLGGAPVERGTGAARLLRDGWAPLAWCTGAPIPQALVAAGLVMTEAETTRAAMLAAGVDSARVTVLSEGTSTFEEVAVVLAHARSIGADTVLVLSTDFHTRRVRRVFRKHARGSGITVLVRAAPAMHYDPQRWWASEEGVLMVNNEYVKLLYYLLRY